MTLGFKARGHRVPRVPPDLWPRGRKCLEASQPQDCGSNAKNPWGRLPSAAGQTVLTIQAMRRCSVWKTDRRERRGVGTPRPAQGGEWALLRPLVMPTAAHSSPSPRAGQGHMAEDQRPDSGPCRPAPGQFTTPRVSLGNLAPLNVHTFLNTDRPRLPGLRGCVQAEPHTTGSRSPRGSGRQDLPHA